ncbi:MAG: hypothetical protein M1831_001536 [Alyxoria varia]|nr:MAG: hypothetical protein M1831_001536 [Alyxoria varia]
MNSSYRNHAHNAVLILLLPLHVLTCLTVFSVEYVFLHNDERVEQTGVLSDSFDKLQMFISQKIDWPPTFIWTGLGLPVTFVLETMEKIPFFAPDTASKEKSFKVKIAGGIVVAIFGIIPLIAEVVVAGGLLAVFGPIWKGFRMAVWKPLFKPKGIVSIRYRKWNARLYRRPLGENEIRILRLHPGAGFDPVRADLFDVDLYNCEYDALSYAWGGHKLLRRFIVVNDRKLLVSDSLHRALCAIRSTNSEVSIWIDAISINQADREEKSRQVKLMRHIYENAQTTIVWLGSAPKGLDRAFQHISQTAHILKENGKPQPLRDEPGLAFGKILSRRWWSRVWVVEEVALSKEIVVKCSAAEISGTLMMNFIAAGGYLGVHCSRHNFDFARFISRYREDYSFRHDLTLAQVTYHFGESKAFEPHDKLYGFLGLIDEREWPVQPDYKQPISETFAQFSVWFINRSKSLEAVAQAENRRPKECSWAVDWSRPSNPYGRILLWPPSLNNSLITGARTYNACGGLLADIRVSDDNPFGISLAGWQADTVIETGTYFSCTPGDLGGVKFFIKRWETLAKKLSVPWTHKTQKAFNRTIVADAWRGEVVLDWAQHLDDNAYVEIDSPEPMYQQYSQLLHLACYQRRFFITAKGMFGLGPRETRTGDKVCVLFGSPVPFILRDFGAEAGRLWGTWRKSRTDETNRHSEKSYKIFGQAFVDTIMDYKGDIRADLESGKLGQHHFSIV